MSKEDLLNRPRKLKKLENGKWRPTDCGWWYEEVEGITIITDVGHGETHFLIPWKSVRSALSRLDKLSTKNKPDRRSHA